MRRISSRDVLAYSATEPMFALIYNSRYVMGGIPEGDAEIDALLGREPVKLDGWMVLIYENEQDYLDNSSNPLSGEYYSDMDEQVFDSINDAKMAVKNIYPLIQKFEVMK
jgi:hypothetical protein